MKLSLGIFIVFFYLMPIGITAQNVTVSETYEDFEAKYLNNRSDDTIYVYNFWATWCKPCVQELPYFDSLNHYTGETPIKLILVSLDFQEQIESTLKPFVKNRGIKNEVVVLTDGNVNSWINKIDTSWSGAIPATLVMKGHKQLFYEKSYHSYIEVLNSILQIINN